MRIVTCIVHQFIRRNFKGLGYDGQRKFVSKYFRHLSPVLKVDCFDIFILYHDDDYKEVDKFRIDLCNIKLSNGRKIQAGLYNGEELISLAGGELDTLEESFVRCTYCFIYLSAVFVSDSWCKLKGQACLMETIYNDEKKWCVRPVLTDQRPKLIFKIPMGLNALKEINYYPSNKLFVSCMQALLNSRINEREDREMKLHDSSNFLKKCDDKDLMRNWRIIAEASRSVGFIRDPNCTGTGFRVGSKYFATARHVVFNMTATNDIIDIRKLRSRKCYVEFEYLSHNQKQNPENLFHFTDIVYENADLDVIILQLSGEHNKSFPPPISMISEIHKDSLLYIISHPNGLPQMSDPKIELYQLKKDDVKNSKEWAASKGIEIQNEYSDIENKDKILFHCASKHGASGALGIMVDKRSNEPHGVLMLLRGYPNFLYENISFTDADKTNFLIVEQGVLLSSVYDDMKSQEKYNDLVEDINDSLHDLDNIDCK
ncbi:unnamed protein product [Mytilus edulis]|uniref:Serine protease n=1 Tax=Mytilus edulis TaxID=6550 RepID=A0A8S3U0Q9_MYTED|nr:unnamed protein product [Mytilus edulis]